MTDPREPLGRLVREAWVNWAREQPDAKASWLAPWEHLTPAEQEVDMRIGEAVAAAERERIRQLSAEKEAQYLIDRGDYADFAAFADLIGGES